jgi:YHS domain-containing protein
MTNSNTGTKLTPSGGCDAEPEISTDHLGQAAATAEDLAREGSGKQPLESTAHRQQPVEDGKGPESQRINVTLDPICGMSVEEKSALRVERDGKTFFFCSEQCLQKFLATIAGVKSDSKAGSCCG